VITLRAEWFVGTSGIGVLLRSVGVASGQGLFPFPQSGTPLSNGRLTVLCVNF
jgi:hypothetical protein